MHTNQLLKRLTAESPSAVWACKALSKYLITDFDILSYLFSSDIPDGQDPGEPHDRTDDLLLITPGALTFYRMMTQGLRAGPDGSHIESQRLEKSVVPVSHVANVHMVWETTEPFTGDAPTNDPRLKLTIQLDVDIPPLGREITLPLRPDEADEEGSIRHQVETFAEALMLEIHDELQPMVALEPEPVPAMEDAAAHQGG